jgi:hypothetical protein
MVAFLPSIPLVPAGPSHPPNTKRTAINTARIIETIAEAFIMISPPDK